MDTSLSESSNTPANEPIPVNQTLTVEVLKIIKESQLQHGLRHSDYQRYRSYCSRRLKRIRKTLHFTCGNMRRYQKRDITADDLTDSKYLLIPSFQAERAWSYAMQLKQEANTEPRKKFHLLSRMRKAIKNAQELEKLSQLNKCDARTKLEVQGYCSVLSGQFYFEKQEWDKSLNFFSVAKTIYEKLSSALAGDDSQTFYVQRVEEIVPNIRYCKYNLGDESAKKELIDMKLQGFELSENIDSLISQAKEKQSITFSEVQWRNKTVLQVKNEKVRLFLLKVQEYEKQIESSANVDVKVSIYENILKESVDTIQLVRDELKLDPLFQTIQRGVTLQPEDKPSNLLLLFSYLTSTRINKTIERNLLMLESYKSVLRKQGKDASATKTTTPTTNQEDESGKSLKSAKPQDIVRLYDIIIQNHRDMANLPGLSNDKQFSAETEFLVLFYKAQRAFYICLFYLTNKKYKEAIGFSFKVESYLKQLDSDLSTKFRSNNKQTTSSESLSKEKLDDLEAQVKKLRDDLNQLKYKMQTASILDENIDDEQKEEKVNKDQLEKVPLSERLDIYFEDNNLLNQNANVVRTQLSYEPIACKPLFFDLALNHVELPSLDDKIDSKKTGQQEKAGVKGLIKGLFGFR